MTFRPRWVVSAGENIGAGLAWSVGGDWVSPCAWAWGWGYPREKLTSWVCKNVLLWTAAAWPGALFVGGSRQYREFKFCKKWFQEHVHVFSSWSFWVKLDLLSQARVWIQGTRQDRCGSLPLRIPPSHFTVWLLRITFSCWDYGHSSWGGCQVELVLG
jgi:hypothetical protein